MDFPTLRLLQAGATRQEIIRLLSAFEASSPRAQDAYLQHLAGISQYDIAAELEAARVQPEPVAEVKAEPKSLARKRKIQASAAAPDHEAALDALSERLVDVHDSAAESAAGDGEPD